MQFQVNDKNPEYDSLYMEGNMDTMAKDNNPQYETKQLKCADSGTNIDTLEHFANVSAYV